MTTIHKSHPVIDRARSKAVLYGSRAKTIRGVIDFLKFQRGNIRNTASCFGEEATPYEKFYWSIGGIQQLGERRQKERHAAYKAAEAARLADADVKRAKADKTFRARFLRSLTRREKTARTCAVNSLASAIAYFDDRGARLAEFLFARETRKKIDEKLGNYPLIRLPLPERAHIVPITPEACRRAGAPISMRGADASLKATYGASQFEHAAGHTEWKGSRPVSYHRGVYGNNVRSFAYIDSEREISYVLHETITTTTLPEGYAWQHDANGVKAVLLATGDDYHVNADDLIKKSAARNIVAAIAANADKRQVASADLAAIADDVCVCVKDSLAAGNCLAGTLAFADRLRLNATGHCPAGVLKKLAPREPRLRIVLATAARRDAEERVRGFCVLAEH